MSASMARGLHYYVLEGHHMPDISVRVTIRVQTKHNRVRRPRTFKWVGYERRLSGLWETGYYI